MPRYEYIASQGSDKSVHLPDDDTWYVIRYRHGTDRRLYFDTIISDHATDRHTAHLEAQRLNREAAA